MRKTCLTLTLIILILGLSACSIPALPSPPPEPAAPPPQETPLPAQETPPPEPPPPPIVALTPIQESTQSADLFTRNYSWEYGGKEWTWELQIPQTLYNYYKDIPRLPTRNYTVYVTHPLDDIYIDYLVEDINRTARQEGFSELEIVEFATTFVQSLPYTVDSVTTPYDEYPRYPIETLVDNGGDCEDTSILLASLLDGIGYGIIFVVFPETPQTEGHLGVGILLSGKNIYGAFFEFEGKQYFYIETTGAGWEVGKVPEEFEHASASIYDMTPVPILIHDWEATGRGTIVELEVTIENLGTAPADNVLILAGFDAEGDMLWNSVESQRFDIPVDQQITATLTLETPTGKHTRLVIQIVDNGFAVGESYSEWFDT